MPKNMSLEELRAAVNELSFPQLKALVEGYAENHGKDFKAELEVIITGSLQDKLEKLHINEVCPECGHHKISKWGKREHIQVFCCKKCGKRFTRFTNTILEKTRWHWDTWVKVLEMSLNNFSIEDMVGILEADYGCNGINPKTVWLWRMKLIHALASLPQPQLTGIVQVDETFVHESQKGSRDLVSYMPNGEERVARHRKKSSRLGVMSPEFATIVTAIDNRGYCVCKVSSLGRLTDEMFVDLFDAHLDNPAYLCTDANNVYEHYCQLRNVPHYERPSTYYDVIVAAGWDAMLDASEKHKILSKLYAKGEIDRITNRGDMKYEEFAALKSQNSLSLAKVNALHGEIKRFIYGKMRNVSTKYLQDYIGFFSYLHNRETRLGRKVNAQRDAEEILIEILQAKVNYTITQVQSQVLELPKPSGRFVALLDEQTEIARQVTKNEFFKFNEEDGVRTFDKRKYLSSIPEKRLYAIAKACKIPRYRQIVKWSVITQLMAQPNINEIILKQLELDFKPRVDEEDWEDMKRGKYL